MGLDGKYRFPSAAQQGSEKRFLFLGLASLQSNTPVRKLDLIISSDPGIKTKYQVLFSSSFP